MRELLYDFLGRESMPCQDAKRTRLTLGRMIIRSDLELRAKHRQRDC